MRVKVRRVPTAVAAINALLNSPMGQEAMQIEWKNMVTGMETKMLQDLCRLHAHGRLERISIESLDVVLEELANRRQNSEKVFGTDDEAWSEFVRRLE